MRAERLGRGRRCHSAGAWTRAYEALTDADREHPLDPPDLELLAEAAYLTGRDEDYVAALERAHHGHLEEGRPLRAVRCAFWIGHQLTFEGQPGRARGWQARAQRLLDRHGQDCVERGYLLVPQLLERVFAGDPAGAHGVAVQALEIAHRFDDRDLAALALMERSQALVRLGRRDEGLRLVDETMVAVGSGELSPIVAGAVYCNTIAFCRGTFELGRAREWTVALTRWCADHPDMVAHRGLCLVHRAEIMTMEGAWPEALREARRVAERFSAGVLNERALGHAAYREGEVHRLAGALEAAEAAYREAGRLGRDPQPGLALLRLAQGRTDAARASVRRALGETTQPLTRAALLPAGVETALAAGDVDDARAASEELDAIAAEHPCEALAAMSAHARGEVALAEGDARTALPALRHAWRVWQELGAPYDAARTRELLARACSALGDADAAAIELEAAADTYRELSALPDVSRLESSPTRGGAAADQGLTARELEVLRLVAAGRSNHAIAEELVISDHTVRRHLQNIFAKLSVSSRAAATAFAFRHDLV